MFKCSINKFLLLNDSFKLEHMDGKRVGDVVYKMETNVLKHTTLLNDFNYN